MNRKVCLLLLTLIVGLCIAFVPGVPTAHAAAGSGALRFTASEAGTKSTTLAVPADQCRQLLAAAHLNAPTTACTHTVTAVSRPGVPPGKVIAYASGWHYAWHQIQECFGVRWDGCYFLALRSDAWFQWNYQNVWLNTPVSCHNDREVYPYSGWVWWCGSFDNGGFPIAANGWGHWMNAGENITVCITYGPTHACSNFWGRMNVDIWGNFWTSNG